MVAMMVVESVESMVGDLVIVYSMIIIKVSKFLYAQPMMLAAMRSASVIQTILVVIVHYLNRSYQR